MNWRTASIVFFGFISLLLWCVCFSSDGLECLRDLLKYNTSQNIRLVVDVAKRYSEQLTPKSLIALFEEFGSSSGLYYYLGSFVNYTEVRFSSFLYL